MSEFQITHSVGGVEDSACAYSQTMPGDMNMSCRLSERGRAEVAAQIDEMQAGRMSGSSTAQDSAMTRECQIRDASGRVIPWGASSR